MTLAGLQKNPNMNTTKPNYIYISLSDRYLWISECFDVIVLAAHLDIFNKMDTQ